MRLTVELDGKPTVVDLADDLATVEIGGHRWPVRVVQRSPGRVDLEIGGEAVVVQGWPDHEPTPPGAVDVNGERHAATVTVTPGTTLGTGVPAMSPAVPEAAAVAPSPSSIPGATAVVPPMPGRVVEVRVRDGDRVDAGAVLLVVEAMKMRNEVVAPVAGVVRELRVREGTNVRARDAMLQLVPG